MNNAELNERTRRYFQKTQLCRQRFLGALENAANSQQDAFERCLRPNVDTAFGREHSFGSIRNFDDYRKAVPIRDYDGLAPWISRAAEGEKGVLTAEDPVIFIQSSGSTGSNKKIPATRTFFERCWLPFVFATAGNLIEFHPSAIGRRDSTLNLKWDPHGEKQTTASGRPHLRASQVPLGQICEDDLAPEPGSDAPWSDVEGPSYLERTYGKLLLAAEADLRVVVGINPAMVAALVEQIAQSAPRLIRDLHNGAPAGQIQRKPNPEAARRLEMLCQHFGELRPHHLWPNLEVLYLWSTGVASLYSDWLRDQFGPQAEILGAPAGASEAPVGLPIDRHRSAGPLVLDNVFYEFIPAEEEIAPDSRTLLYNELEAGRMYHLVLTQLGGLYRYSLGDVFRVVDHWKGVPRVEYSGRKGHCSVAGEKLTSWQVLDAVRSALSARGLRIRNFTCGPRDDGAKGYAVALEPAEKWVASEHGTLETTLDEALCVQNGEYSRHRRAGELSPVQLRLMPRGNFHRDWEQQVKAGRPPTQVKDTPLRPDATLLNRLASLADSP